MRIVSLSLMLLSSLGAAGCVKPYQREILSQRSMNDALERSENRFRQHWQESREGGAGGFATAGGGCGCN